MEYHLRDGVNNTTRPSSASRSLLLLHRFFFSCVWLVPFAYFISLSINEFVLPCEFPSYKQQQQDNYSAVRNPPFPDPNPNPKQRLEKPDSKLT